MMERYSLVFIPYEAQNVMMDCPDGEYVKWEEHRALIKKISHLLAENYVEYCPICKRCSVATHEGRIIRHKKDCDLYLWEGK